jgi:hypothetical protein
MPRSVELVHAIPGRSRFRLADRRTVERLGPHLGAFLEGRSGVRSARVNPSSRSVVVVHDPDVPAEALGALLADTTAEDIERAPRFGGWVLAGGAARASAVVPARNEEKTVGGVVAALGRASLVDEVVVVDNGSDDSTAQEAETHGAKVVPCAEIGKGQAMRAGVGATDAEVVLFSDADLVGLRPEHADSLLAPVLEGRAAMACGLFDRGWLNPVFLYGLPVLTGQRAVTRRLFEAVDPAAAQGYRVEAELNERCRELGLPTTSFVCPGLWHRTKERKYPSPVEGYARKAEMLAVAGGVYARRRLGRLFP